jgi:hypothetical protein
VYAAACSTTAMLAKLGFGLLSNFALNSGSESMDHARCCARHLRASLCSWTWVASGECLSLSPGPFEAEAYGRMVAVAVAVVVG